MFPLVRHAEHRRMPRPTPADANASARESASSGRRLAVGRFIAALWCASSAGESRARRSPRQFACSGRAALVASIVFTAQGCIESERSSSAADDAERPDVVLRFRDMSASTRPADALHVPPELDGGTPDGLLPDAAVDAQLDICNVDRGVIVMTDLYSGTPVGNGDSVRTYQPYALNDTWTLEHSDWLHEPCYNDWEWSLLRTDGLVAGGVGESYHPDGSLDFDDPLTSNGVARFLESGEVEVVLLRRDGRGLVPPQTRSLRVVVE